MRGRGYRLLLAGSAVAWAGALGAAETATYGYDALGRLVRVERSGGPQSGVQASYGYDCAGNRLEVAAGAGAPPAPPPPPCPAAPVPPPPPPPSPPPPPPPGNQPPVPVADSASIPKCGSVARDLIVNDSDPEGHALALVEVTYDGSRGTASRLDDASAQFVSNGLSGTAAISYVVRDALGAEAVGSFEVTVTTVNACG